jgi:ribonuclease HI
MILSGTIKLNTPSSTRAELWGVILAIAATPKGKKMTITLDSIAAINIATCIYENPNRNFTRHCCPALSFLLAHMFKQRQQKIEFKWVKGHSGAPLNELADKAASLTNPNKILKLKFINHAQLTINRLRMDADPLKLIRKLNRTIHTHTTNIRLCETAAWEGIDLECTKKNLTEHDSEGTTPTSRFALRAIFNQLPTGTNPVCRTGESNMSPICRLCNLGVEDTPQHVFKCSANPLTIQAIEKYCAENEISFTKKNKEATSAILCILPIEAAAAGIVPEDTGTPICTEFFNTAKKIQKTAENLWRKRCEAMKELPQLLTCNERQKDHAETTQIPCTTCHTAVCARDCCKTQPAGKNKYKNIIIHAIVQQTTGKKPKQNTNRTYHH